MGDDEPGDRSKGPPMRTHAHTSLLALATFVVVSGCASEDGAGSDDVAAAPVETTVPVDTLPAPDDPAAAWADEIVAAWNGLLAANEAAITEYIDVFDGYTPDEVAAYRDLVAYPGIADAVASFPSAPSDDQLADLYAVLTAALAAELDAGSEVAAQIDENLDEYQAAAEDGSPSDYDQIRTVLADARDTTTRACLDLAAAMAERDLPALKCVEGPGPDEM